MKRSERASSRRDSGKLDIIIIAVFALILVIGLIFVLLRIIGHSEEHVEKIKETKFVYTESLSWRPEKATSEKRVSEDLRKDPNRTKAVYEDLELSEECFRLIARMKRLEDLKLTRSKFRDSHLSYLIDLPIETLGLNGSSITDKAIPYILKLKRLQDLHIGDTDVTDGGLKLLSRSRTIIYLDMKVPRCVTNQGVKFISAMPQLERLELATAPSITGECIQYLRALPNLSELNVSEDKLKPEELRGLSKLPSLVTLDVSGSGLGDEALPEIAKSDSIKVLDVSDNPITTEGLTTLAHMKRLSYLRAKGCAGVDRASVTKFKSRLPNCELQYFGSAKGAASRENIKQQLEFLESEAQNELETGKR